MVFSSISFLYYFLPITLAVYFLVPKRFKNPVLLLASLFFYFVGEPVYCIIMVLSSLSGYLHGLWIDRARGGRRAKAALVSSIVVSVIPLLFFKYTDFFIQNINWALRSQIALLRIILPIGISFYTFQILSYTIDVYRGTAAVQKNFLNFAMYVSLFPQLIAGPIVRYTSVQAQIEGRKHTLAGFAGGVRRFIIGLGKKVLLANVLGELLHVFPNVADRTVLYYWLSAIAFMLHVYFDFSGYSDMAIGLGRMFGFEFLENFNYPYISKSIAEFWRRWHMSLGTWFRDYVYIPMGGNRVRALRWMLNIAVVWFLTGFWHGAQWNFIVWGLAFAALLVLEKLALRRLLGRLPAAFSHIYVLFFLALSFALFNADSLPQALESLRGMFGLSGAPVSSFETLYHLRSFAPVLLIAGLGATPLPAKLAKRIAANPAGARLIGTLEPVAAAALLLLSTAYLIDGSFNPFLYFRF